MQNIRNNTNEYIFTILGGGRVSQNFISAMKIVYDFLYDLIPPSKINVILPEYSITAKYIRDPLKWSQYSTKGLEIEVISGKLSKINLNNINKALNSSDLIISAFSGIKWSELVKYDQPRIKEIEINGPIAKEYSSLIPGGINILNVTNQTEVISTIFHNQLRKNNKSNIVVPFGMRLDAIRAGAYISSVKNDNNIIRREENVKNIDVCGLHGIPIVNTSRCIGLENILNYEILELDPIIFAKLIKESYEIKEYVSEFPKRIVKNMKYLPDAVTGSEILDLALEMVGLNRIIYDLKTNVSSCTIKKQNLDFDEPYESKKIISTSKDSFLNKEEKHKESSGIPAKIENILELYYTFKEEYQIFKKNQVYELLSKKIKKHFSKYKVITQNDITRLKDNTDTIFFCGNDRYLSVNNYNPVDKLFAYQGLNDLIRAHIIASDLKLL